jgi:hypothetical protein
MNRSISTGIALALVLAAGGAGATEGKSSPLRCGLGFGKGDTLQFTAGKGREQKRVARIEEPRFFAPEREAERVRRALEIDDSERRVPPTFTLARVGCSWR